MSSFQERSVFRRCQNTLSGLEQWQCFVLYFGRPQRSEEVLRWEGRLPADVPFLRTWANHIQAFSFLIQWCKKGWQHLGHAKGQISADDFSLGKKLFRHSSGLSWNKLQELELRPGLGLAILVFHVIQMMAQNMGRIKSFLFSVWDMSINQDKNNRNWHVNDLRIMDMFLISNEKLTKSHCYLRKTKPI